jgi:hypothetical protein
MAPRSCIFLDKAVVYHFQPEDCAVVLAQD